jgi:hypothetical protein
VSRRWDWWRPHLRKSVYPAVCYRILPVVSSSS